MTLKPIYFCVTRQTLLYEVFCNDLSTKVTQTCQSHRRNLDIWFLRRRACPTYSHDPVNRETPYVLHQLITQLNIIYTHTICTKYIGDRGNSTPTFTNLCDEADERLFYRVTHNTRHLLHPLLPPRRDRHYSFRQPAHDFELPDRTSELKNKNFLRRMLFKQHACSTSLCRPPISQP